MKEHKNFWDKNAGRYDHFMQKDRAAYEEMYALIRPAVKEKTVLELATGTGLIAKHIVNTAAHIEATDASAEMIAEAKRDNRSAKLHFSVQDMFRLPYADKSFDVVIVSNALHIVPQPEKALQEIKRVLKDDGTLIAQGGLSQADIVYEMQVESITRNMFLFMDTDVLNNVFPIRSARSYFVSAALSYDAIFAHCGKSGEGLEFADTMLVNYTDADDIEVHEGSCGFRQYDAPYFGAVHSMTTTGERLQDLFAQYGTRTTHRTDGYDYGLHFTEDAAPVNGEAAGSIHIVFPTNKITDFSYDAEKGGYTSTQWNSAYTDGNTGESVVFENVLVLYSPTSTGIDEKNHSAIYTYDYQDAGYFFNGGYAEPITWSRGSVNEPFRYYTSDGSELQLGVGKTYIAFVSEYYGGASYS